MIRKLDKTSMNICKNKWDSIAKPLESLGIFEEIIIKIAGITKDVNYHINKKAVVVMCADNGVVSQNVTQTSSNVTAIVAQNIAEGKGCINHMAKFSNTDVFAVDIGMKTDIKSKNIIRKKILYSTGDISLKPAMTRQQAINAIKVGIDIVCELKNKGYKIIATGEMGIGNTTTSSAIISVLLDKKPEEIAGKGAGLSNKDFINKINVIYKAIEVNKPNKEDIFDVISKVGGLDIAGMTGVFIGGALYNIPIIVDGFISLAAALCAVSISYDIKDMLIASHLSAEKGAKYVIDYLELKPVISANMRLGEGTGAVSIFPLLDMVYEIYRNMSTFSDINIENYKHMD